MKMLDSTRLSRAEDNHNLIYSFLHQHGYDIDEWYGLAAIGYVKAMQKYEPSKGSVSNWTYRFMRSEIRSARRKVRPDTCELCYEIVGESSFEEEICFASDFSDFLGNLNADESKMVELRLRNKSQSEIAKVLGTTQVQVSRTLSKLKTKVPF